jgi:transcription elongation factor Elf1
MERQDNQYTNKKSLIIILKESLLNEIYIKHVKHKINLLKMAEMNKIKSFRSFSDVLAHEAVIKLAVENNAKRSELSTKIASILDSMEITSFEGLEEEQKTAIISQLFGEISEEETEENLPEVSDEEEQQVDEAKFVKDFNKDVLNAKTREEVLELYPNAEFFTGKSDHFFGELDNNLFFKAYYTKAQKEFSIKSVYSEKGSNYVHLYNRIGESLVTEGKSEVNAFLSMISKDYQFDKKHDDYTGFLNTDPSDMDDVAIEFINNVDKYKSLMKKHGLSLEPGYSDKEAIFVKESVVTEAKELFQLDIDSDEHGALGLSVTMKELKDVYKKNKKDINDVEDLLLKFVYAQPEDFAANDTEGMEISGANVGDVQTMLSKEFGIKESVVNEAIKVEGKRDAKKVVTVYNKIFNKVLVDLGAMSTESILGCIKYLTFEAMGDANFHREADAVSKMIKGNIKPLEIKMNGLGGHFIKIGPATIKSILDKYYSDIANAAGWSGIGIVEGTALYLEQIKQEAMGQAAINKFNQTFEGEDVRVDLDSKINESNEVESITVSDEATKLEERNAFLGARAKAIEEDLEEFEFNGKTYPVTINESTVFDSVKCSNKKGHSWKQVDKDGTVECEHCGLRNSLSEEVVTEEVEEVEEGNAFGDAVRKAKEAGDKEFEFDGKTYKVEEANN